MDQRLAVVRLTLSDFRRYSFLRLDVDKRAVVLTGPNGAGKTNILEALSFLAPGRGLRRARLAEVTRHQAGAEAPWAVAARLAGADDVFDVGTGREAGSERRILRIDGQTVRGQAALAERLVALWLTPAMDRLFVEGAGGRRRFLDRLVLGQDPAHASRAGAYEHAMRERTRLLKEGQDEAAWLETLEDSMARQGVAMAAARRRTVERLNEACGQGIGAFPAAALRLAGSLEDGLAGGLSEDEAMAQFRRQLADARRRDAAAGAAVLGPHRSDLQVRHAGKDLPAEQCSTGEQKAVLVAIVLGQARIAGSAGGRGPLLLLDEVTAHLDGVRRAALFDELDALPGQSWLTGTDEALFAEMGGRGQFFRVHDGVVAAA